MATAASGAKAVGGGASGGLGGKASASTTTPSAMLSRSASTLGSSSKDKPTLQRHHSFSGSSPISKAPMNALRKDTPTNAISRSVANTPSSTATSNAKAQMDATHDGDEDEDVEMAEDDDETQDINGSHNKAISTRLVPSSKSMTTFGQSLTTEKPSKTLFNAVSYYLNPILGAVATLKLRELLNAHGAKEITTLIDSAIPRFDLSATTHIITEELEFPEYEMAVQSGIVVVKPEWVYKGVSNGFVHDAQCYSADPRKFFSGMVVAATEKIPESDCAVIFGGVQAFGGQYRLDLEADVTHLVSLEASGPIYEKALACSNIKIVLPHYFDDCLRIKRKIPERVYQFPEPPLLTADPFSFVVKSVPLTSSTESETKFLLNQTIYIHPEIITEIGSADCKSISLNIAEAGGRVASSYDNESVTCVVLPDRQSDIYVKAERAGKLVGSLRWLKDTLLTKKLHSPKLKALHYPQPEALQPFKDFVVCATNYNGQARESIECMVVHLGGKYTKQMTPENTHVICAKPLSEKYNKALEWDIVVVNHLWLEDTYVNHKVQVAARIHYLCFPPTLLQLVGSTPIPTSEVNRSLQLALASTLLPNQLNSSRNRRISTTPLDQNTTPTQAPNRAASARNSAKSVQLGQGTPENVPSTAQTPAARALRRGKSAAPGSGTSDVSATTTGSTKRKKTDAGSETTPRTSPRGSKRRKDDNEPAVSISFTGIKLPPKRMKEVEALGGIEAKDVTLCTHLVTSKVVRTEKFLMAVALGKEIVVEEWIHQSVEAGRWLNPKKFQLHDKDFERRMEFSLSRSLETAKRRKLLEGYSVYVTPQVQPNEETMRRLVEASGGKMIEKVQLRKLRSLSSQHNQVKTGAQAQLDTQDPFQIPSAPSSPGGTPTSTPSNSVICISLWGFRDQVDMTDSSGQRSNSDFARKISPDIPDDSLKVLTKLSKQPADMDMNDGEVETRGATRRRKTSGGIVFEEEDEDGPIQSVPSASSKKRARRQIQEDDDDDDDFEVPQEKEAEEEEEDDEEGEDEEDHAQTQLTQKTKMVQSTGRSTKYKEMPTPGQVKAMTPSTGTVESVELFNFMCHKLLRVQFNPKINFVIGHNGKKFKYQPSSINFPGGKSAILTALTVCLGGKASFTNRGSSIKSLLKEGTSGGSVSVTLRNQGPDAYRPEAYGDRIAIERRIMKDGSGGYRIKACNGKVISTKREEIVTILDHFSIAIDNPMAILTQDTSRMFLANSSPKQKYNFFLKGTLLAQLSTDHAMIKECITRAERTVTAKEMEIEASQNLEKSIEDYKKKVVWAFVSEKEALVQSSEEEIAKLQNKKKAVDDILLENNGQFQETLQYFQQAEAEKLELFGSGNPLTERMQIKEQEISNLRHEIGEFSSEEKNVQSQLKLVENNAKNLHKRIREEQSKLNGDAQAQIEQQQAQIAENKEQLELVRQRQHEIHQQHDQVREEIDRLQGAIEERENNMNTIKGNIADDERHLRSIQAAKDDRLRAFPQNLQRVVHIIEQLNQKNSWRGNKPIGPCGALMTINKPEFAKVIQSIMNKDLNSFICFNHEDAKVLRNLLRQNSCDAAVIVTDNRVFDYSEGESDPHYLTVLRALDFANPVVMRQMILNYRIEALVLVNTRHEGDAIAVRGFNNRIRGVFSRDLLKFGGQRGGLQTNVMNYRREWPVMQMTNRQSQVDEFVQRVRDNKALLQEAEYDLAGLKEKRRRLEDQLRKIKTENQKLINTEKSLQFQIQRLEEELQEEEPANIAALEADKRDLDEQMLVLREQLANLRANKEERNVTFKELQTEKDAIKNELNVLKTRMEQAETTTRKLSQAMEALVKNMDHHRLKIIEYDDRIQRTTALLEAQKKDAEEELSKALQFSDNERITLNRNETMDYLEKKIRELEIKLREARRVTGSPEEVQRKLNAAQAEYAYAKAELKSTKRLIEEIDKGLKQRIVAWAELRRSISIRAKNIFTMLMRTRGFTAHLILDHQSQTLDLRVDVHGSQNGGLSFHDSIHNADSHNSQAVVGEKDPKTLSGGEKSFSTVCLLLSLWESMGNPFRALDEYDVFMDAVNRKISTHLMIENARKEGGQCQYIFITPLDMSNVAMGPDVKINRLSDPERNQTVLNFGGNR
ncbi:Structural maintenance of chromosomes protein 6 [Chytridiales sp. JEL 0842]|nr:Structural maintenance of chromosomes protein 6 [Chytridiales sp. JEL 0842]